MLVNEFKSICPISTRHDILYGLSKVHKTGIDNILKIWLILLAIYTPFNKLAKFSVLVLSPITITVCTVKDSLYFAKEVINLGFIFFMTVLDTESLFINIPIDKTIKNQFDLF